MNTSGKTVTGKNVMSVSLPKVPGVTVSLPTISTVSSNVQQNLQNVNNIQPGQSLLTANRVQPGKYQSCNEGSLKILEERSVKSLL